MLGKSKETHQCEFEDDALASLKEKGKEVSGCNIMGLPQYWKPLTVGYLSY